MKLVDLCLGIFLGLFLVGGALAAWMICGSLQEVGIGLLMMGLVIFGWPT